MEIRPLHTVTGLRTTQPIAADKPRARARLERVFEKADRFGQEQGINPGAADSAIDAAVHDVRTATSGRLPT
jgi:hypothetical protein